MTLSFTAIDIHTFVSSSGTRFRRAGRDLMLGAIGVERKAKGRWWPDIRFASVKIVFLILSFGFPLNEQHVLIALICVYARCVLRLEELMTLLCIDIARFLAYIQVLNICTTH